MLLRWCWNWQTGMVEGHVPQGVWVQLPPSALEPPQGGSNFKDRRSYRIVQGPVNSSPPYQGGLGGILLPPYQGGLGGILLLTPALEAGKEL